MTRLIVALALALLAPAANRSAQDPPAPVPHKTPVNDIFSGTITQLSAESVTVERTALVRETVRRTFILDAQTVVEGTLKAKTRVSVRYTTDENGQFHALHIIVR